METIKLEIKSCVECPYREYSHSLECYICRNAYEKIIGDCDNNFPSWCPLLPKGNIQRPPVADVDFWTWDKIIQLAENYISFVESDEWHEDKDADWEKEFFNYTLQMIYGGKYLEWKQRITKNY